MTNKKIFNKILLVLAVLSFVVCTVEGFLYYGGLQRHWMLQVLMIIQNSMAVFLFSAKISIGDVLETLAENPSLLQMATGYAYALAVVLAPLCTATVLYRVLEVVLGWRIDLFPPKDREHILIYGYNENVHTLLEGKKENQRIRVVTSRDIADHVRRKFLRRGVSFHMADCLSCPERELKELFREVELRKIQKVILLEDTSEKNFSLYYMLAAKADKLSETAEIYCSCEDEGIHRMLEDCYEKEAKRKNELVTFNINELQVRDLFRRGPLHTYYQNSEKSPGDWRVHLLILGFGGLGQQVLLQAMNLGVASAENEILIDVIDYDIDKKQDIFCSSLNRSIVNFSENEFSIPSENADGGLRVRFHRKDVRGREFQDFLEENGKADPFTYAAICMQDPKVSLHALFETERFLAKQNASGRTPIGIRMDMNAQMTGYLAQDGSRHGNVLVIGEKTSFELIFDRENNEMARQYHKTYQSIQIKVTDKESEEAGRKKDRANGWRSLIFFRRDSNRALAYHDSVKQDIIGRYGQERELLHQYFGREDSLLHREGDTWVFCGTEQELAKQINSIPFLRKMAMLEHRRWCYFMISKGWGNTTDEKNDYFQENPCIVSWDRLCALRPEMCKYDLISLLVRFEQLNKAQAADQIHKEKR